MPYTYKQLATCAGVHESTIHRWIKTLEKAGSFRKTSPGKLLNQRDAENLAKACGFDLPGNKPADTSTH